MNELPSSAERFSILAFVAMLHIAVYWLLASKVPMRISGQGAPLELMFLARPSDEPVTPAAGNHNRSQPLKRSSAQAADDALSIVAPRGQQNDAKPIDWNAELERAAESGVLDGASHAQRDFGFPHPPAEPAKPTEFGWDHVHTHRVEPVPGGGLLINLNDHCVLLVLPLPFLGCHIGSKPANGDLFEHMRDEPQLGPSPVP
jgi:hypothetical protein